MKAVTKTRHYDAIARAIYETAGHKGKSSYKPSELAEGVRAVSSYQYEDGYHWGYTEGEEQGYNDGIDVGYNSGHKKGYNEGRESFPDADLISFPDASITEKAVTDTTYYDKIARMLVTLGETPGIAPNEMAVRIAETAVRRYEVGFSDGESYGRRAQHDEFWGKIQNNGGRRNYRRMFGNREAWDDDSFKPVYDMVASTMQECFAVNSTLTSIKYKANGKILTIDGSSISSSTGFNNAFDQMTNLQEIGLIISNANAPWLEAFRNDTNLVEVSFGGTIGKAFDIHYSTKLSSNSLLSILKVCNKASAGVTITLPAKCINGSTVTETYIANDTELNTALTNARLNGYTVSFD